jgi:hypothetical protein
MEPDTLTALLKVVAAVVVGVPLLVFLLQERLIFMPQRSPRPVERTSG